jgi:hypothetical protein
MHRMPVPQRVDLLQVPAELSTSSRRNNPCHDQTSRIDGPGLIVIIVIVVVIVVRQEARRAVVDGTAAASTGAFLPTPMPAKTTSAEPVLAVRFTAVFADVGVFEQHREGLDVPQSRTVAFGGVALG